MHHSRISSYIEESVRSLCTTWFKLTRGSCIREAHWGEMPCEMLFRRWHARLEVQNFFERKLRLTGRWEIGRWCKSISIQKELGTMAAYFLNKVCRSQVHLPCLGNLWAAASPGSCHHGIFDMWHHRHHRHVVVVRINMAEPRACIFFHLSIAGSPQRVFIWLSLTISLCPRKTCLYQLWYQISGKPSLL